MSPSDIGIPKKVIQKIVEEYKIFYPNANEECKESVNYFVTLPVKEKDVSMHLYPMQLTPIQVHQLNFSALISKELVIEPSKNELLEEKTSDVNPEPVTSPKENGLFGTPKRKREDGSFGNDDRPTSRLRLESHDRTKQEPVILSM